MSVHPPERLELLTKGYRAMLDAADPRRVLPAFLPARPKGRTVIVGVGKAAAAMAQAVEAHWSGALEGVIVVPEGAALPLRSLRVLESSHPVPDERSVHAAQALLSAVRGLGPDDMVLALVSGGGSSLCALPMEGMSLAIKRRITQDLLASGASIHEMNVVRQHMSGIKGGRLAVAARPARVVTLVISDIPGDDAALVASGPTSPMRSTSLDALAVLRRYDIEMESFVQHSLEAAGRDAAPLDGRGDGDVCHVIASAWDGLKAAAEVFRAAGIRCHVLGDALEGEARDLAAAHAGVVHSLVRHGEPFEAPCVLLSGGEATVTLRGKGVGGRNTEFALALAIELEKRGLSGRVHALSAGTDGLDGCAGAAGAWIGPRTLEMARAANLNPHHVLDGNDSGTLFRQIGALLHTGPTHTNINDFRALWVEAG